MGLSVQHATGEDLGASLQVCSRRHVPTNRRRGSESETSDLPSSVRTRSDQKVYEALCHAAPDFPDEVAQILLELCHRRPESPEIVAREIAYREKRRNEAVEQEKSLSPEDRTKRRLLPPPI